MAYQQLPSWVGVKVINRLLSTFSNNSITTVSATKLRDYTQASRSRSYTDRKTLPLFTTKLRDYTQPSRSRSYTDRKTLSLQSNPVPNETARQEEKIINCELIVESKLYEPQNSASTIIPWPHRNCETTLRPLVKEAIRTTKHCLYNQPLSTTKLRHYTQASRSSSYTDHKTAPYNHPL
ncbi:hypothetical protein J6590_084910 [Homalodisca vitripennis]|nr:hypothetical protein J6590_084910 [Homalodisca vitripennis]